MTDIVILSATRTPLGAFQGTLASVPAPRLGATAVRGAVAAAKISPADVTDVLMGNVLQAGQGQAPARQAAIYAGLPHSVRCTTVNKVCGSGLQTIIGGAHFLGVGLSLGFFKSFKACAFDGAFFFHFFDHRNCFHNPE